VEAVSASTLGTSFDVDMLDPLKNSASRERRIPALSLSRGFGIGPVRFLDEGPSRSQLRDVHPDSVETEIQRFRSALNSTAEQLRNLAADPDPASREPVAHILGIQLLIIEGSEFAARIEKTIRDRLISAGSAVEIVAERYLQEQSSVTDPHLREKRLDIEDVATRLRNSLRRGQDIEPNEFTGSIIVARELHPSAVTELARQKPAGFVTERGGWTSHSSIIAREFGIPMVSGIRDVRRTFDAVERVMVDGIAGSVILHPDPHTLDHVGAVNQLRPANVYERRVAATRTLDGIEIALRANVGNGRSYLEAKKAGANGIGLFRSESLIIDGSFPSEDEQFAVYAELGDLVGSAGVNVRTFDIHADVFGERHERNPVLGLHSLRLSLVKQEQFRIQIRALLRASSDRNISIILPMVSGIADITQAKNIINEERRLLSTAGGSTQMPKVGAMIELPAAVLTIDTVASQLDFLCLGTNDLVQYLLAVDRDNQSVADWYESLHPAVVTAIRMVIKAAQANNIPLIICGEMAGSPFYAPVLIGLGARELSMNIKAIDAVRHLLSGIRAADCTVLAERVSASKTAVESEKLLNTFYTENWSTLFPPGVLDERHVT
jgi:phosphotransferase system enzyme I (PtsI)